MNLIVTDFEATCWNKEEFLASDYHELLAYQEIIEIGCCIINPRTLVKIKKFSFIIRPVYHPTLSKFCKNLTGITQDEVDSGALFSEALDSWVGLVDPDNDVFCSWGAWDRKILQKNCDMHKKSYPFAREHLNLKALVADEDFDGRQAGIKRRCNELGIKFIGNHHRGLDDSENIVSILLVMSARMNESFDTILSRWGYK